MAWCGAGFWFFFSAHTFDWRAQINGTLVVIVLLQLVWLPLFGNVLALAGIWRSRHMDTTFGTCLRCGYSLRGVESRHCPECGAEIPATE